MKAIKFLKLTIFVAIAALAISCVEDDDYSIPPIDGGQEPDIIVNSSINAVKEAWDQNYINNDEQIYTFEVTTGGLYFEGYVVSSDYGGNFYKSLIVQDNPENPTAGIQILVNKTALFESFEVGRKVYVKLDGLSVGYDDGGFNDPTNTTPGRYTLGMEMNGEVDDMSPFLFTEHIMRSTTTAEIVPKVITSAGFTQNNINTFVQLQNMQFSVSELGKTYAGEGSDEFDGFRDLVSCGDETMATLQTSTFADFKSYVVPSEVGSINAVLAKDFRADFFVLIINNPVNVDFTSENRCDPLFVDDFSNGIDAWTAYNVTGAQVWYANSFGNPEDSATMSGFSGGNQDNEDWLISPAIDLSGETGAVTFGFDNVARYAGPQIEVYMCTDYNGGDPTTDGTWVMLPAAIDTDTGSWSSWTYSGDLDVSAATGGDLFVAFKYVSTTGGSSTFEIDNVIVK